MSLFKKAVLTMACLTLFTIGARASATAVYIAQNAAGAANGADCADAKPVSFFNNAANWGNGLGQIGPGTTVHFCGTFTGGPNSNMVTVQGSGTSGNPITLLLEPGALFTAPYWSATGGAIGCNGFNYITLDGGGSSLIQNTANGTGLTYQQDSAGVDFEACDHGEVRGLNIQNIYVHTGTGSVEGGHGILYQYIPTTASIHGNTVVYAENAIDVNYQNGASSISIYNNTTDYHKWGIAIGSTSSSCSASGINVYGNSVGPHFDAMLDSAQTFHGDGIIIISTAPGTMSYSNFYNNYIHGDMSASFQFNSTGYLFLTGIFNHVNIFNNVIGQDILNPGAGGPEGLIRIGGTNDVANEFTNGLIANNTFYGPGPAAIKYDGDNFTSENNIFYNVGSAYLDNLAGPMAITSKNNDFYGFSYLASYLGGVYYNTFAAWQAVGFDVGVNGSNGNPLLSSSYVPQSGSAAIGLGANLSNLGLTALNSDKAGTPRPASGPWAAGAYQFGAAGPTPPSGLIATVQ